MTDPTGVQDNPLTRAHQRPACTIEPWAVAREKLGEMTGDERLVQQSWEDLDAWAYIFVWHCLVSF